MVEPVPVGGQGLFRPALERFEQRLAAVRELLGLGLRQELPEEHEAHGNPGLGVAADGHPAEAFVPADDPVDALGGQVRPQLHPVQVGEQLVRGSLARRQEAVHHGLRGGLLALREEVLVGKAEVAGQLAGDIGVVPGLPEGGLASPGHGGQADPLLHQGEEDEAAVVAARQGQDPAGRAEVVALHGPARSLRQPLPGFLRAHGLGRERDGRLVQGVGPGGPVQDQPGAGSQPADPPVPGGGRSQRAGGQEPGEGFPVEIQVAQEGHQGPLGGGGQEVALGEDVPEGPRAREVGAQLGEDLAGPDQGEGAVGHRCAGLVPAGHLPRQAPQAAGATRDASCPAGAGEAEALAGTAGEVVGIAQPGQGSEAIGDLSQRLLPDGGAALWPAGVDQVSHGRVLRRTGAPQTAGHPGWPGATGRRRARGRSAPRPRAPARPAARARPDPA